MNHRHTAWQNFPSDLQYSHEPYQRKSVTHDSCRHRQLSGSRQLPGPPRGHSHHPVPGIRFENYGSAGAAVQSFLPNAWENTLAARVAFSRPADLTLLFLGTNDAEQLTPRFGTEYRQLVKRLQTLGPVVAVIPPKTARPALNRRLERIRQDILTADIPVIDLWNVFVPLAADGMHPTALGQQEIARHIACGLPRALGHCTPDCQDMTLH